MGEWVGAIYFNKLDMRSGIIKSECSLVIFICQLLELLMAIMNLYDAILDFTNALSIF